MKEVGLENFRCYTEQVVKFKSGINLLIGDNASGKTSLLKACRYVLSAFFSGFSDENTKWIGLDVDDFSLIERDGIILPEKPILLNFTCDENMYDAVMHKNRLYNPGFENEKYQLCKKSKKSSRSLTSGIAGYRDYSKMLHDSFMDGQNGQIYALPLFAGFTTEDIHTSRKINSKRFQAYNQKASFGYYECLAGEGFFPYWIKRLLILKEGGKGGQEIDTVRKAIVSALGDDGCNIITDMQIRPIQGEVYYIFSDGREIGSEFLSDGYRRLVNIVTDLAFRCALLNRGIYGTESTQKTRGIVLIDEIDLHLHPKLQAVALKALKNTFPKIQFIVTTHAPMVMSGVENNENNVVYKLDYSETEGYTVRETQTYGLDVSTITEIVLQQTPRDSSIDYSLARLFEYIDDNQVEDANKILTELKDRFGDGLPELAQAEAMLNFAVDEDAED